MLRRTLIGEGDGEMEDEDLIPREDMVVTVTHGGYVKRVGPETPIGPSIAAARAAAAWR